MHTSRDDAYTLARMGKFSRQEAANRASADYAYSHE
jgi:hypothetical protein